MTEVYDPYSTTSKSGKWIVYFTRSYCVRGADMDEAAKNAAKLFEADVKAGFHVTDCLTDIEPAADDEELDEPVGEV